MGKKNSERDIFILAGTMLKFMYIFKLKHMIHNYMIHKYWPLMLTSTWYDLYDSKSFQNGEFENFLQLSLIVLILLIRLF